MGQLQGGQSVHGVVEGRKECASGRCRVPGRRTECACGSYWMQGVRMGHLWGTSKAHGLARGCTRCGTALGHVGGTWDNFKVCGRHARLLQVCGGCMGQPWGAKSGHRAATGGTDWARGSRRAQRLCMGKLYGPSRTPRLYMRSLNPATATCTPHGLEAAPHAFHTPQSCPMRPPRALQLPHVLSRHPLADPCALPMLQGCPMHTPCTLVAAACTIPTPSVYHVACLCTLYAPSNYPMQTLCTPQLRHAPAARPIATPGAMRGPRGSRGCRMHTPPTRQLPYVPPIHPTTAPCTLCTP